MTVRVVIANQSEARFFDSIGFTRTLLPAGGLLNPAGRLHDRELESDRPGRVYNFAATPGRRRGSTPRHGANGERSTHQHVARRVGEELRRAHAAGRFDRVVLVAPPAFLGRLRRALPEGLRAQLAGTLAKDLINQTDADLRSYLSRSVASGGLSFRLARRTLQGGGD